MHRYSVGTLKTEIALRPRLTFLMNSVIWKTRCVLVLLPLLGIRSNAVTSPKPTPDQTILQIELANFGYEKSRPAYPSDKAVLDDPHLLMEDYGSRVGFVSENVLVVYFSHKIERHTRAIKSEMQSDSGRLMDAFFFNSDSGALIARRTWNTLERQWFNDSYDTQARIVEVRDGFLVHAGTKLELYSTTLQLLRSYDLGAHVHGGRWMWSVAAAPGGNAIHLQPTEEASAVQHNNVFHFTGSGETEGIWLRSDTFEKIHAQLHRPGPDSVSDSAVVTRGVHCLELHPVGEPPHNLCCSDTCGDGLPMFLGNQEILSTYSRGFTVLSINGNELWTRKAVGSKGLILEDQARSMNGFRFAISATSSADATLDGLRISQSPEHTILVYDSRCRERIFARTAKADPTDFALGLSPEGRSLAVLTGTSIAVYRLHEESCGGSSK